MSNVVSMERTCEYLVRRASASRRKGNYDSAMTLLLKAKDQFGLQEEIELEMARVYDEIECEEEAARAYLRVVRLDGKFKGEALFQLAVSALQRADLARAASYYELFLASGQSGVSSEYAGLLGEQLLRELDKPMPRSKRGRAVQLKRRGVERIQTGNTSAARRTLSKSLALRENAQTRTLLACCALMDGDALDAIEHANRALARSGGRVQALLVLADAYALAGEDRAALRSLYLASMRAKSAEDILACALESAKRGQDCLTLRLTHRLLKTEPNHTRAMMLRACALTNLGKRKEASRLFGRVCVLMPENTVSEALFRAVREGDAPDERLSLGLEVPYQEGVSRAAQMVAALYMSAEDLRGDRGRERMLCRYAAWAFRSQLAGEQVATVALLVMLLLDTQASNLVLDDVLMDPAVDEVWKSRILQMRVESGKLVSFPVDLGGRLVYLAAGGAAQKGCDDALCRRIVQRAADALLPAFGDAPQVVLTMWLSYLKRYGAPPRRAAAACASALECAYHMRAGHTVNLKRIARNSFVSPRLCRYYVLRMLKAAKDE